MVRRVLLERGWGGGGGGGGGDHVVEQLSLLTRFYCGAFQPVDSSIPKSPSPTREVPSTTTVEPSVVKQLPLDINIPVQSPEDNQVSSMSDGDTVREPVLQGFIGMLRLAASFFLFSKRLLLHFIQHMSLSLYGPIFISLKFLFVI